MKEEIKEKKNKKSVSKKKRKKLLFLFIIVAVTILLLIGGTYAWFIGLGKVQINSFDLEVTAGNQMELSLDAINWYDDVTITESTVVSAGYEGNKNHGVGLEGMKPVSSVGTIDQTASVLKLYSKTSLTSTKGGYRLVADQVQNSSAEEDGYFVFDLFIRNGKDPDYIVNYNYLDDEDIYMIKGADNSAVGAPSGGEDDYGIANSVRVAFMQIGRIRALGYTPSVAQGITCEDNATTEITGLCNKGADASDTGIKKTWNIWEPNDDKHDAAAVERFNLICKKRGMVGDTLTYSTDSCEELEEDTILTTYCVNQDISADMGVDIYDGINDYNTFTPATYGLTPVDTLTDTEVNTTDNSTRQEIFKLAANSITKVRVYIYIEGQDVDNYDMIYKGEKIKVKFGFTRDRYEMENN